MLCTPCIVIHLHRIQHGRTRAASCSRLVLELQFLQLWYVITGIIGLWYNTNNDNNNTVILFSGTCPVPVAYLERC